MNTQTILHFEVISHYYINERGEFIIGKIKDGVLKIGMQTTVNDGKKIYQSVKF